MTLFLTLATIILIGGWLTRTPMQARWLMIGLVYVVIVAALILLPEGAPLRATLGGEAAAWLALGALVAMGLAYSAVLRRLRARVLPENRPVDPENPAAAPPPRGPMSDGELDRYARHIILREVGGPGQKALKTARVLVIGAGGLGAPVLQYLAAAGVGTIGVIDDDTVSADNLQRQVIHTDARIGMPKVFSAEAAIRALNPYVTVRPYHRRLREDIAADLLADYDLVLDGSDNFDTRYLVNRACAAAGRPLIAGAIAQWEGQISLYDPTRGTPCFECVFPDRPAPGLVPSCAEAGVIGPLPGVVGSMMALEAVKHIAAAGTPLAGEMLIFDGLHGETRKMRLARRPDCPVCGAPAAPEPAREGATT